MKEINPIGIRLGLNKFWRIPFVEKEFNYVFTLKNVLTVTSKIYSILQYSSHFLLYVVRKLFSYYQFLKKKFFLFFNFLFKAVFSMPKKISSLSAYFLKNNKTLFFFFDGYSKYQKKTKTISLLLFYFLLVKRTILSSNLFFSSSGLILFDINFIALVNKFKIFRQKFYIYKTAYVKTQFLSKIKRKKKIKTIQLSKKYFLFLKNRKPFVSLSQLYNFILKSSNNSFIYSIFRFKKSFFLKRFLRKKNKIRYKKNFYLRLFLKRKRFRNRHFLDRQFRKRKKIQRSRIRRFKFFKKRFFRRIFRFRYLSSLSVKKQIKKKKKFNFSKISLYKRKKWFFLKKLFLKKLRQLRFKIVFFKKILANKKITLLSQKLLSYYYFYFNNMLCFINSNKIILNSNKIFVLYSYFLKYNLENFISYTSKQPLKLYFKNLYKYIKINKTNRHVFYLLRKRHFKYKKLCSRYFFFIQTINILIIAISTRNARLVGLYLASALVRTKKHFQVLQNFRYLILEFFTKIPVFLGIKIKISGKFHGRDRSSTKILFIYRNLITILTFKSFLDYHYCPVDTYTGTFGLHTWLYYN